jgi:MoaA/NifB/PqqE/SkfB family radical SAM enzyme
MSTGISCSITPEAFRAGELGRIIELGKRIGIHEVLVFDALPTGRYKHRADLIDNPDWVEEMIESLGPYNQDPGYPGVVAFAYMTSHRSVGCSCGTSYLYISPYGDVMSCDFNHAKFGNILETPLYRIWDRLSSLPEFREAKWGGCKIKDSEFRAREMIST